MNESLKAMPPSEAALINGTWLKSSIWGENNQKYLHVCLCPFRTAMTILSRHLPSLHPETRPYNCLPFQSNGGNAPFSPTAGKKIFLESCSRHLIVSSFSTEKSKTWNPHFSFLLQFFPLAKPSKALLSIYVFYLSLYTHTLLGAASQICYLTQWWRQLVPELSLQGNTWGHSRTHTQAVVQLERCAMLL